MRTTACILLLALTAELSLGINIHVHGTRHAVDVALPSHERWSWTAVMMEVVLAMRLNGEPQPCHNGLHRSCQIGRSSGTDCLTGEEVVGVGSVVE